MKDRFYTFIENLQNKITQSLEEIDGAEKFKEDFWKRPGGGGGRSRVISEGSVFEKGGVSISKVYGPLPSAMQDYFKVGESEFFACGLSLVLHPVNPYVPTVHANFRYFEMLESDGDKQDQWFGGGLDLTPYYLFEGDARHFHSICKDVCDRHDVASYQEYKQKCDDYFFNHHRGEARGIGGLFYDYCKPSLQHSLDDWYNFQTDMADHFLAAYIPIVEKRKDIAFAKAEKEWQEIRRGRYVEFNLLHDKGTLFGLKTAGRIESILMSLPPTVRWKYDHQPSQGSEEARILEVLKNPRQWV